MWCHFTYNSRGAWHLIHTMEKCDCLKSIIHSKKNNSLFTLLCKVYGGIYYGTKFSVVNGHYEYIEVGQLLC